MATQPIEGGVIMTADQGDGDKYVVVKKEAFDNLLVDLAGSLTPAVGDALNNLCEAILPDAVVIRRQDVFAGPALHTYAANIALVAKLLANEGINGRGAKLAKVADYFHDQAVLADDQGRKLPD